MLMGKTREMMVFNMLIQKIRVKITLIIGKIKFLDAIDGQFILHD
jgi:high-affinity nickel permease